MVKLNKFQKITIIIIVIIVIGAICYYVYTKDENIDFVEQENLEITEQSNISQNNQQENINSDSLILVHVSGSVNREGIVELRINSRISDAIDKAGGLKEDADIKDINLAYKLEDGMKIYIPNVNEPKGEDILQSQGKATENGNRNLIKDKTSQYVTSGATKYEIEKQNEKENTKVNINTATQTQLETLPGIGPSTALKIIEYRKENGNFLNIEDIKNVNGIGDAKFSKIKEYIYV